MTWKMLMPMLFIALFFGFFEYVNHGEGGYLFAGCAVEVLFFLGSAIWKHDFEEQTMSALEWIDNSDNLLQLNGKLRKVLDSNDLEVRKEVLWYLERIQKYQRIIESREGATDSVMGFITVEQAKFQWTFWQEALIWYIKTKFSE